MCASYPVGGIYSEVVEFDLPSTASKGVPVPFKIVGSIYRLRTPQQQPPPPTFGVALFYISYYLYFPNNTNNVAVTVDVGGNNYSLLPQSGNKSTVAAYTQNVELCTTVTLEGTITFPKAGTYEFWGTTGSYAATGVPQEPYSFYYDAVASKKVTVS